MQLDFFRDKRILITGHTGFKGSWLCHILVGAGAKVIGYALDPPTQPSLFEISGIQERIQDICGDVRDGEHLLRVFKETQPELVIHMAAQPIVRTSYEEPVYTYETNVMGTVHVCEAVRQTPSVRSFLNVTTDKVYENREWAWGYRENEPLDGHDPYSNSKSCSELVTHSYRRSFLEERGVAVSTARAGNVLGGGDFAKDRIIPDCIRAMEKQEPIIIRNPHSTRPYQHVLEPLMAYLMILERQYKDPSLAGSYNVGPNEEDCITTGELAQLFCDTWGEGASWENRFLGGPHEAQFLKLDCSLIKSRLGWQPRWHLPMTMEKIVEWTRIYQAGQDVSACMDEQIREYCGE